MIKILNISLLLIILVLLSLSLAQGTYDAIRITDNELGFGARALGMGGAYVGVADDYSATYWNPGGLAQMRKMEFWMELSNLNYGNSVEFQGNVKDVSTSATKFNSIGFTFPIPTYRGSLVFAFGYQRLKDFEYQNEFSGISAEGTDRLSFSGVDPDNPNDIYDFFGRDVEKTGYASDDGSINQWSFAGAVDVSPTASVGLALNFWTGKSNFLQDFDQFDIYNNFDMYPADFNEYIENRKISSKYSSFNAKFGALFKVGNQARIGLGIESPQTFKVKEDYSSDGILYFDNGDNFTFPEEGNFEYNVKIPFRFSGGVSVALGKILLSGSTKYTDWSQVKFDTGDLNDLNRNFKTGYRGTFKLNFGAELGIPLYDSQIRAGYIYDPTPLKNMPSDNNRKYLTFGLGTLIDRMFKIDIAYLRGTWKQTTYDDLTPEGTFEDITYQKLLLNFAYRF
jgi:long-subunit fatty acid transport protein